LRRIEKKREKFIKENKAGYPYKKGETMSDEEKEQAPEPEKEQQIDFGTELPNPTTVTDSEDGSKKPQW
jgi:hypothetical protein